MIYPPHIYFRGIVIYSALIVFYTTDITNVLKIVIDNKEKKEKDVYFLPDFFFDCFCDFFFAIM